MCDAPELAGWRALSPEERLDADNRKRWGAVFSKALKAAVQRAYGAPLRAWVQWAADNLDELKGRMASDANAFNEALDARMAARGDGKSLSVVGRRVADRFALLCASLVVANDALGLTLGERVEILAAFVEEALAYADKQRFFDGAVEAVKYLDRLEEALAKFGSARFQEVTKDSATGEDRFSEEPRQEFWG